MSLNLIMTGMTSQILRTFIGALLVSLLSSPLLLGQTTHHFSNIETCQVVSQTPEWITFDVQYFNSGSEGRQILLGISAYEGKEACDYAVADPIVLRKGRSVARVSMRLNQRHNGRHNGRRTSDTFKFYLYRSGQPIFETQTLRLKKDWGHREHRYPERHHPREFSVCLDEVIITSSRDGRSLNITAGGRTLGDNTGWKCSESRRGIYTLQHKTWKKRFWLVDTNKNEVLEIKELIRGFYRGRKQLKADLSHNRRYFTITLPEGHLIYNPEKADLTLKYGRYTLSECKKWRVSHHNHNRTFHMMGPGWKSHFWDIDTATGHCYTSSVRHRGSRGRKSRLPFTVDIDRD